MDQQSFELGDLVEITSVAADGRRPQVMAGTSRAASVGERGIVVEKYSTALRVLSGTIANMKWEANCLPEEVCLIERLGMEEATRRLRA